MYNTIYLNMNSSHRFFRKLTVLPALKVAIFKNQNTIFKI